MNNENIDKIGWSCVIIICVIFLMNAVFSTYKSYANSEGYTNSEGNTTSQFYNNTSPAMSGPNNIVLTDDSGNLSTIHFPKGVIIPWIPDYILPLTIDKIGTGGPYTTTPPAGWAICDGSKNTPDLRGRFLLGANSNTNKNDSTIREVNIIGGEQKHKLLVSELPTHKHSYTDVYFSENSNEMNGTGLDIFDGSNNKRGAGRRDWDNSYLGKTKNTADTGTSTPHNNIPPFYTIIYIMKL